MPYISHGMDYKEAVYARIVASNNCELWRIFWGSICLSNMSMPISVCHLETARAQIFHSSTGSNEADEVCGYTQSIQSQVLTVRRRQVQE